MAAKCVKNKYEDETVTGLASILYIIYLYHNFTV